MYGITLFSCVEMAPRCRPQLSHQAFALVLLVATCRIETARAGRRGAGGLETSGSFTLGRAGRNGNGKRVQGRGNRAGGPVAHCVVVKSYYSPYCNTRLCCTPRHRAATCHLSAILNPPLLKGTTNWAIWVMHSHQVTHQAAAGWIGSTDLVPPKMQGLAMLVATQT